jgi:UDP-N-acetylmuramate dehydrogenase
MTMTYETLVPEENKLLSSLTTFGIGGPARYFFEVHTVEGMREALAFCRSSCLCYMILGKGSNCLFDDRGFNGVIIANRIDFLQRRSPGIFCAGAGYSFSLLGTQTARQGYSGLEFASGIPGSVGGAVFMNAGANGREACESLDCVEFMTEEGELLQLQRGELSFSYRTSSFQSMPGAIISVTFRLDPAPTAREKQFKIIDYRKKTQPYGEKSAGCVFRNPECSAAGALIDHSGLKGVSIGGAQVSPVHANFIVNTINATAADVRALMQKVKQQVKEKTGIELESEIRCITYEVTSDE